MYRGCWHGHKSGGVVNKKAAEVTEDMPSWYCQRHKLVLAIQDFLCKIYLSEEIQKSCTPLFALMSHTPSLHHHFHFHFHVHLPPFFLVSHMAIGTRASNALAHPGHIVLGNQKPRRSRQQINEDDARKKAAAAAKKNKIEENRCTVLARIAQLEESMEAEDKATDMHATWPDLLTADSRLTSDDGESEGNDADFDLEDDDDDNGKENRRIMTPPALTPPASTDIDESSGDGRSKAVNVHQF